MVNKFRGNQCIIKNESAFNQRRLFIGYTLWRSGLSLLAKVLEKEIMSWDDDEMGLYKMVDINEIENELMIQELLNLWRP